MFNDPALQKWQGGRIRIKQSDQPGGLRRRVRLPCFRSQIQLRLSDFLALRKKRGQLVFVQLTKTAEPRNARKFVDADQTESCLAQFTQRESVQQINQLHLAEQIVFEPEHYFFVIRESRQRLFLGPQLPLGSFKI